MKSRTALITLLCALFFQSCMLVNPVKRQPLYRTDFNLDIPHQNKEVLVLFKSKIPGKPLFETVWDNMQGAFWSPVESNQIGYTQDYEFTPLILPTDATVATTVRGTQIVIPVGRVFSDTMVSAIEKSYAKSKICFHDGCRAQFSNDTDIIIAISIDGFSVKERPMNHINFQLKLVVEIFEKASGRMKKEIIRTELNKFKLGSIASTSYGFIEKMNEAINSFAKLSVKKVIQKSISNDL